jgi:hypothetical protein
MAAKTAHRNSNLITDAGTGIINLAQNYRPPFHHKAELTAWTARMLAADAPPAAGDAPRGATLRGLPSIRDLGSCAAPPKPWNSAPPTAADIAGGRNRSQEMRVRSESERARFFVGAAGRRFAGSRGRDDGPRALWVRPRPPWPTGKCDGNTSPCTTSTVDRTYCATCRWGRKVLGA